MLYLIQTDDRLIAVVLVAIVAGGMVSYVKAKAESLGIECEGGFAERTERLMIALIAISLHGLNLPYILAIGMWILALASVYTAIERMRIVYVATKSI
jgi:CDP-diacylglycerol--glycerol-3-phosphate 3-phosphatidyltransferase